MTDMRYALLIDAENTSAKYVDAIIRELKEYGIITYGRLYGDFTNPCLAEWSKKALEYALVPIQQQRYASGKNSSDIMLVIDAMDILYQHNVDGFCLVTSDSDFTRLVNRIREDGMTIIGMGKSDASKTFIAACSEYKFLDKISEDESEKTVDDSASITPVSEVKKTINQIIQQAENKGERANLGALKNQLQRVYPDFDERNYGYNAIRKFIDEATKFKLIQDGTSTYVVSGRRATSEDAVKSFVKELAKKNSDLGVVGQEIHKKYPDFKIKDFGYSQLSKFISSIEGVYIEKNGHSNIVKLEI